MNKTLPASRARQGNWGRPVLIILVVSLVLAMLVWAGVEFYGQAIETPATQTGPAGTPQPQ